MARYRLADADFDRDGRATILNELAENKWENGEPIRYRNYSHQMLRRNGAGRFVLTSNRAYNWCARTMLNDLDCATKDAVTDNDREEVLRAIVKHYVSLGL